MKLRVVMAMVVCTLGAACTEKDTGGGSEWARTVEPRLTGTSWRACRGRQCGTPPAALQGPCDALPAEHADAVRILSTDPRCTDVAIEALERFARADPNVLADLAGAYYIRARRDAQPPDLLDALEAADQAVRLRPGSAAAHFNRGLIQAAVGLHDDAIASFHALRLGRSDWAKEARHRRDDLLQRRNNGAIARWTRTEPLLDAALRRRDGAAVAKLIEPFPAAAQRYLEETVLGQWAATGSAKDLVAAKMLAAALARRVGDRFMLDSVAAIENASAAGISQLRLGHRSFREGRMADLGFASDAAAKYAAAADALARGGSPFRISAALGEATVTKSLTRVEQLAGDARPYPYLGARIAWIRGRTLADRSDYLNALEQYGRALAHFEKWRDYESALSVRIRIAGVYRGAGQSELAWRELVRAAGEQHHIGQTKEWQTLFGESAGAALALGHPRVALRYRDLVIQLIQDEFRATRPDMLERYAHLRTRLQAALRQRAQVHVANGDLDRAAADQEESNRLTNGARDPRVQRNLDARYAEVEGRRLLRKNPKQAVDAFSRALRLSDPLYRTFRASLHAQRAKAHRNAREYPEAENDLQQALEILRAEEEAILRSDKGNAEALWSTYFSRFDEAYEQLIDQLVEQRRFEEAFAYAERARAFEPLHRILQLGHTPDAFRRIAAGRDIKSIQAALPPGTFVIEYSVTRDRTHTWILSRDRFTYAEQPASREDVLRWTKALQRAADRLDYAAFEAGLVAPHHELLQRPLSIVQQWHGSRSLPRLVIIPDRVMQGLPFSALRGSTTGPYLLEQALLEFQGSALLYVFSLLRDRALTADRSVFIVGDPAFDPKLPAAFGMKRLDYANEEARTLLRFYGAQIEIRTGEDATAAEFLDGAGRSAIVHLAAHGVVNTRAPHQSMLLLAPGGYHNGTLQAQDLPRSVKFDRTRLVILSTCSSAGGAPVGPEGVAPLVRPIISAGVPAVIGTLWDVNDATAREVLVSFHRHFKAGRDAADALREAQLDLLRNDRRNKALQRALNWAPYQVIGHATSPFDAVKVTQKEEPP